MNIVMFMINDMCDVCDIQVGWTLYGALRFGGSFMFDVNEGKMVWKW
jgi:hypothetical protein